ncbi:TetR-like C-terminal domain-containing protein [Paracoccus tegillarcae]|uniref:HTH-type transcriptional regulator MT1864/Rv1816-like C-terminal domain-containing protein n=1 Tax=Paracoccus tegillarcae TaxID=1529068 RepID=A0A2K9EN45_9RHOB|nr:TetR-like C-terminal domain-containing protein [Paracoccus tegillarcae]AUH34877.1 hypothetical protein CUV01_17150 [Paracoccus tegillarcae]
MEMLSSHRPALPSLPEIAKHAGQDVEAVEKIFGSVQEVLDTLAEQGLMKLVDTCLRTVTKAPPDDPAVQFRALSTAYLEWACDNPEQFRLLQYSKLVDIEGNEKLARYVRSMHDVMLRLLHNAQERGQIVKSADPHLMLLTGRALLLGLARMVIDDNMNEWHPGTTARKAAQRALDDYMDAMTIASGWTNFKSPTTTDAAS